MKKGIISGFLLGLSGFVNLYVNNRYLSPLLFSLGLISIIILNCNLYTGKIGYVHSFKGISYYIKMLLYNMFGAGVIGIITYPIINEQSYSLVKQKSLIPIYDMIVKSFLCGVMIYLAVELYKRSNNIICIILPVYIFVICGFEHCVANIYYIISGFSMEYSYMLILYVFIYIIGNSVGSILTNLLCKEVIII